MNGQRIPRDLEQVFPRLTPESYRKTSDATPPLVADCYNCIAYAADDMKRWWEPRPDGRYRRGEYWPDNVPTAFHIDTYRVAFESLGYIVCDNGDLESGLEKVALY